MENEKKKIGRPEKYRQQEHDDFAYNLCLLGATDEQIAKALDIMPSTLYLWKKKYKSFSEALKKGKIYADAKMAKAFYHRGLGYSHEEEKVFCDNGNITKVSVMKHYPPDTAAAFIWLKNRDPERWRDRKEIETKIVPDEMSKLTDEDLEAVEKILSKYKS